MISLTETYSFELVFNVSVDYLTAEYWEEFDSICLTKPIEGQGVDCSVEAFRLELADIVRIEAEESSCYLDCFVMELAVRVYVEAADMYGEVEAYSIELQVRHAVDHEVASKVEESFRLDISLLQTIEGLLFERRLETASMVLMEIVRIEPSRMNKVVKPVAGQEKQEKQDEELAEIDRILNERRAKNTSRQSLA